MLTMLLKKSEALPSPSSCFGYVALVFVLISIVTCTDGRSLKQNKACPRVINGTVASQGRFPYMCSIRRTNDLEHACGGTLIKGRWVLTAAHCLDTKPESSTDTKHLIYCGIHHKNDDHIGTTYSARVTYVHGKWESDVKTGYDIALIQLDRVSDLSVPKLASPTTPHPIGGGYSILGWGVTNSDECSDELQIGRDLEVVPKYRCNKDEWPGIITDSMICGGNGSVDAARGDSGGPFLQLNDPLGHYEHGDASLDLVVGITSFGVGEGQRQKIEKPGVYTSVSVFRKWIDCVIEGKIPKEDCPATPYPVPKSPAPSASPSKPLEDLPPFDEPVLEPEESVPPPDVNRCVDFELLGDDFEDEDALARMKEAIKTDDSLAVECILEAGLDANTKSTGIEDPLPVNASLLHQAAFYEAVEAAKVLIDHGADVDVRDSRERTPLHIVAQHGSLGVAKVLVRQGAKLNVQSKRGDYPLHFAAYYGRESIVEFLAKKGADVNSKNENEETPLHIAAAKGFVSIVEVLVNNEASKSETTSSGETPFDVICQDLDEDMECNDETRTRLEDLLSTD